MLIWYLKFSERPITVVKCLTPENVVCPTLMDKIWWWVSQLVVKHVLDSRAANFKSRPDRKESCVRQPDMKQTTQLSITSHREMSSSRARNHPCLNFHTYLLSCPILLLCPIVIIGLYNSSNHYHGLDCFCSYKCFFIAEKVSKVCILKAVVPTRLRIWTS